MSRPVTIKTVQIHNECICGYNEVESNEEKLTWKDLRKLKARVKLDKKTKERFFLIHFKNSVCSCFE